MPETAKVEVVQEEDDEEQWEEVDDEEDQEDKALEDQSDKDEDEADHDASAKQSENICFSVYDAVKIKVDVTEEFPLDIKCSLLITQDDMLEYGEIKMKME